MNKKLLVPLFACVSILLSAYVVPPAAQPAASDSIVINITTAVKSDGSGSMLLEIIFSKAILDTLKTYPNFPETGLCKAFQADTSGSWTLTQEESNGGIDCKSEKPFKDLATLKSMTQDQFGSPDIVRLEIANNHFYYDLAPNMSGSAFNAGSTLPMGIEAYWILKVPGSVVSSNADTTSGSTLTWDLTKLTKSTHLKAESDLSGGIQTILIVVGVLGGLGCCCLVILAGAAAIFFFLRRKRAAPAVPASAEPAA